MRTLTCQHCHAPIANTDDHTLISASLCLRCSHPAYYDHLARTAGP